MTRGATAGFVISLAGASYLLASPFVAGLLGLASIILVIAIILLWATSHLLSSANGPKWPAIIIALSVVAVVIQASSLFQNQYNYYQYGSNPLAVAWQIPGSILALIGGVISLFATRATSSAAAAGRFEPAQPRVQAPPLAICPMCKARIPVDAKFCAECGADLRPKTI